MGPMPIKPNRMENSLIMAAIQFFALTLPEHYPDKSDIILMSWVENNG